MRRTDAVIGEIQKRCAEDECAIVNVGDAREEQGEGVCFQLEQVRRGVSLREKRGVGREDALVVQKFAREAETCSERGVPVKIR